MTGDDFMSFNKWHTKVSLVNFEYRVSNLPGKDVPLTTYLFGFFIFAVAQ